MKRRTAQRAGMHSQNLTITWEGASGPFFGLLGAWTWHRSDDGVCTQFHLWRSHSLVFDSPQVSYGLCHSPTSFGGNGPKFTLMETVGLQAGGNMIPALFWVDGWGWLYEMVLSGRYTQQPGQPVLGEPPCGHGETVMVSVDSHGPAALCSGSFTPICSGLEWAVGWQGFWGSGNRALLCLLPSHGHMGLRRGGDSHPTRPVWGQRHHHQGTAAAVTLHLRQAGLGAQVWEGRQRPHTCSQVPSTSRQGWGAA